MPRYGMLATLGVLVVLAGFDALSPCWPDTPASAAYASAPASARADDEVTSLPFCVASLGWSAGSLGKSVLYRAKQEQDRLDVGYFVYWSTERPWGRNRMSLAVVPAMLTDAVYSHFLFLFPGLQRLLYGPGDVEGVRVTYRREGDRWTPVSARADDERHDPVELGRDEIVDEQGRVVVMTRVWSHQLGAHRAAQAVAAGVLSTCFSGGELKPLEEDVARAFRLGTPVHPLRARPGWIP